MLGIKNDEIAKRLEFAKKISYEAGKITLDYFQKTRLQVSMKKNSTPVSEADKRAEEFLRKQIKRKFPGEGIVGEEYGAENNSDAIWILDPIDGTESFIRGVPLYSNLIGFEYIKIPLIGVANFPALDEAYFASKNSGSWWKNHKTKKIKRAQVSKVKSLTKGMACFSSAYYFKKSRSMPVYNTMMKNSGNTRGWGDAYGHCLVATGRADFAIDPLMEIWDSAALLPIVEEAGGVFTDFKGKANIRGGNAISTNGILHKQCLRMVKSALF